GTGSVPSFPLPAGSVPSRPLGAGPVGIEPDFGAAPVAISDFVRCFLPGFLPLALAAFLAGAGSFVCARAAGASASASAANKARTLEAKLARGRDALRKRAGRWRSERHRALRR